MTLTIKITAKTAQGAVAALNELAKHVATHGSDALVVGGHAFGETAEDYAEYEMEGP